MAGWKPQPAARAIGPFCGPFANCTLSQSADWLTNLPLASLALFLPRSRSLARSPAPDWRSAAALSASSSASSFSPQLGHLEPGQRWRPARQPEISAIDLVGRSPLAASRIIQGERSYSTPALATNRRLITSPEAAAAAAAARLACLTSECGQRRSARSRINF